MNPNLFRQFLFSGANPVQRDQIRERLMADQDLSDQQTGQLHRLAPTAALAQPNRNPTSVFPYALGLAATLLAVFMVVFHQPRTKAPEPLPQITLALVPRTLRDGSITQSVNAKPNQPILLHLQYQDTAPQGECHVEITGQPFGEDSPCGLDFHPYTLPQYLAPGQYILKLTTPKGELIHAYQFTLNK